MTPDTKTLLERIDAVLESCEALKKDAPGGDLSRLSRSEIMEQIARLSATIEGLTPDGHRYRKLGAVLLDRNGIDNAANIEPLQGVLSALRYDIERGALSRWESLVRSELFTDFIDVAAVLLDGGFKDAAAVVAGATLETHLKKLCVQNSISLENPNGGPIGLTGLRKILVKKQMLSGVDASSLMAWITIRNAAAHGNYKKYTKEQVRLMIDGVRDFIVRHPV